MCEYCEGDEYIFGKNGCASFVWIRDLRSIAEMMNNFHHERLRAAWKMIYG